MWRDGLCPGESEEQLWRAAARRDSHPLSGARGSWQGGGTCRRKHLQLPSLPSRPHLGQMLDLDPSYQVLRLSFEVLVSESLFWVAAFLLLPYDSPWIPTPVGGLGWRWMEATVSSVSPFCLQSTK